MGLKRPPGRRLLMAAGLAVAGYYALWGGEYSAFDLRRLAREQRAAEEALAATRAEADSLRALAGRLESDAPTIERVARERFGMIRDGETLYRFVPVDSGPADPRRRPETP
ncbi:MAG TPA: septum formation initiator family protein [Longimicrobiaceae bacterium]|nr:septum formation initiator family protein [Longimicrobiaceae bacterium]